MRLGKYIAFFVIFCTAATFAAAQSHMHVRHVRMSGVPDKNCLQKHFSKHLSDTLFIYFKVGKSNIDTSFRNNGATLNTFNHFLTEYTNPRFNFILNGITLQGSASPEGKQHWNRILANRRADATAKYLKNEYSVNQQLVQKDNVTINTGAHHSAWPELRSTRVIVDYSRVSKEKPLPQVEQPEPVKVESTVASRHKIAGTAIPATAATATATTTATTATATTATATTAATPETEIPAATDLPDTPEQQGKFRFAVKTNALYDILLTPNIGVEIPVTNNWTVAANWMYAWWKADPSSWYHRVYGGDIEIRKYINQWPWKASRTLNSSRAAAKSKASTGKTSTGKSASGKSASGKASSGKYSTGTTNSAAPLTGWHIGAYAQMLTYDFEWGGTGYLGEKWSYAAGIAVGYSKNIAKNLNLDFTLGVGYLTGEYKEYEPIDNCYVWQATKHRHWVGPTKAEVSLVWLLGRW